MTRLLLNVTRLFLNVPGYFYCDPVTIKCDPVTFKCASVTFIVTQLVIGQDEDYLDFLFESTGEFTKRVWEMRLSCLWDR